MKMHRKTRPALFLLLGITLFFSACNRTEPNAFINQFIGTWKLESYTIEGENPLTIYDAGLLQHEYTLVINDNYRATSYKNGKKLQSLRLTGEVTWDCQIYQSGQCIGDCAVFWGEKYVFGVPCHQGGGFSPIEEFRSLHFFQEIEGKKISYTYFGKVQ